MDDEEGAKRRKKYFSYSINHLRNSNTYYIFNN